MIPLAITAIENHFKDPREEGKLKPIPSEFQGYISSMGASVMQMGLLPTLAVFADQDSGAKEKRSELLEMLAAILSQYEGYSEKSKFSGNAQKDLFKITAKMNAIEQENLKSHLLDAAVALKLSLRTFKLQKS